MRRASPILCAIFLLAACHPGYGPVEDLSGFTSARLADDGDTVLFTYHRIRLRRPTGFGSVPDSGIPRYITDVNLLGVYSIQSGKTDVLRREKNREGQPGRWEYAVLSVISPIALVAEGGQLPGPDAVGLRHLLADFKAGVISDLDLKADLARHGRDPGEISLASSDGTLLFITPSIPEAQTPDLQRSPDYRPQLWARLPSGEYLKIAYSHHVVRVGSGEVIYWDLAAREYRAFSLSSRSSRALPDYDPPAEEREPDRCVGVSADRKTLELGTEVNGLWTREALPLDASDL